MRSGHRLSDRTLRSILWGVSLFQLVTLVCGVLLAVIGSRRSESPWGGGGAWGDVVFNVVVLANPVVGLLILRRQPRNTVGWLLEGIGIVWAVSATADNYAVYGLLLDPGSLPGADVAAVLNEGSWAPVIGLVGTFLVLLFPDGHLPSPRWRPVAWVSGLSITAVTLVIPFLPGTLEEGPLPDMRNPLGSTAAEPVLTVLLAIFLPLLPLSILACAVGLVQRFRRSSGVERLQLKWLATAGAAVAFLYLCTMLAAWVTATFDLPGGATSALAVLQNLSILSFVLLPAAIGTAVLRHGLYGIDVVINRALVYGSLTATLLTVYVGTVLLLQVVLAPVTQRSDLAVAGSTLAVAGLFGPARRRIQTLVNRRFYRRRYDATRTLDAFAVRLRHEVDLEAVGADLRAAVDETVQPAHVSLWLRP